MEIVRLSSKGQFVLPKSIRDRHHWEAGTEFIIIERGSELIIKPARVFPPSELEAPDAPSIYQGKTLSLDDMEQAIRDEAGRHR